MTAQETLRNLEIEDGREIKGADKFKYLGFILSKKKKKYRIEYDRPEILSNN